MADISRLPGPNADIWDWQLSGACRGEDPDAFFHPEGERGPAREARERVWGVRKGPGFRERADAIQERHGSRRSGLATPRSGVSRRSRRRESPGQLALFESP